MIAANKRFLKANLTQGVLGIQTNLITLYSNNLSAVATQAALLAGFSFTAISREADVMGVTNLTLSYVYIVCFTVCLVSSLFVLTQATIVVMFGPTMALKGSTDEAVKVAAGHMKEQQMVIFKVAGIIVTSLFLGACIVTWANASIGIATILTAIYLVVYHRLLHYGREAYFTFIPKGGAGLLEMVTETDAQGNVTTTTVAAKLEESQEALKTKLKAILWKRQSIEEGGLFVKYFAVLEKGRLDFYHKEKDYRENVNPVNTKPVKLWQFDLETDYRKYAMTAVSFAGVVKSAMIGNDDFRVGEVMTSEYDLQYASKHFKFGLVPKVSSELHASFNIELLAHDDRSYRAWVSALRTVIHAYDAISALPSIEQTIQVGTSDVETVVQAANINMRI